MYATSPKKRMFTVLGKNSASIRLSWSVVIDDEAMVVKNCHHIQFEN